MSKALIIGNWKCGPSDFKKAQNLQASITKKLSSIKKIHYMLAVPSIFFSELNYARDIKSTIGIQDIQSLLDGPYTNKYTADMAATVGVEFTILNHSETKSRDSVITLPERVRAVLETGMICVLCVGEEGRDSDNYLDVINKELLHAISAITPLMIENLIVAYEPIWAIGNSKNASTEECMEAVISLRRTLADIFGMSHAKKIKLLYGGSVNESNAKLYIDEGGVDGLLVGHASLDADKFARIVIETNK